MQQMTHVMMAWAVVAAVVCAGEARGAIVSRNASTPATVAETRALWLSDCGIDKPEFLVDFETGFVDQQNISGVAGLFPAGLVIDDSSTADSARIRGAGAFGGSSPNGTYGVAHNERPYLELLFPLPGVDYFALADIDHTGTSFRVHHSDGTISTFSIESAGAGEFVGVWRNDMPPIVRVQMDATGDGTWGIDDVEYGGGCRADFNGDAVVDFFDYLDFVAAFDAEDPAADFNADGSVDFFDYLDFAAAFDTGCE